MYTKEDIKKAKQYLDNEGYGTGSNFTLNVVANLMAEYAAKNCVIPAVIKSVYCECENQTEYTDANGKTYGSCSCGVKYVETKKVIYLTILLIMFITQT